MRISKRPWGASRLAVTGGGSRAPQGESRASGSDEARDGLQVAMGSSLKKLTRSVPAAAAQRLVR